MQLCPIINNNVVYLECLECDDKICKKIKKDNKKEKENENDNDKRNLSDPDKRS